MKPLISPENLLGLPSLSTDRVALFDARSGKDVVARFEEGHLAGARHVHLEQDLSAPSNDASQGGRHPLPSPATFSATVGRLGIRPETHVVIYDDKGGANAASRFWWMLRAAGHSPVQVLDGGMRAALDAGFALERGSSAPSPAPPYPFTRWPDTVVDADAFARIVRDPSQVAIDVRSPARYRGEEDAFDPNPGHVEGAVNVFFERNLNAEGRFLPPGELAALYGAVIGDRAPKDVVLQCGSGVTACHALLALEHAELPGARLYVGSFSEWTRQGRPVATGD